MENGAPVKPENDITNYFRVEGGTYTDSTGRLSITRIRNTENPDYPTIEVVFSSGIRLELIWVPQYAYGNVYASVIKEYAAAFQSRGIIGSTDRPPQTCKFYMNNVWLC